MRKIYEQKERQDLLKEYVFLNNLQSVTDKEKFKQMLRAEEERLLSEIEMMEERERKECGGEYDLSRIMVPVIYEDERILLHRPELEDREPFLNVKRQYAFSKVMIQRESYQEGLWEEQISEESLYYSIIGREHGHYIGYCGVKDLKRKSGKLRLSWTENTVIRDMVFWHWENIWKIWQNFQEGMNLQVGWWLITLRLRN